MKKLILAMICLSLNGCYETANGTKLGTLVKCAQEGLFIKTYECELIRGGLNNSSGSFGASFHFTVSDKKLIEVAERALNQQKEIKLSYHQELITIGRTETQDNSFADDIQIVN